MPAAVSLVYVVGLLCTVPVGKVWFMTTRTSTPAFFRAMSAFTTLVLSRMYIVMCTEVVAALIAATIWVMAVVSGVTMTLTALDPPVDEDPVVLDEVVCSVTVP